MTRTGIVMGIAMTLGMVGGRADGVQADAWDRSVPGDGTIATRSELLHGSDELHDLQSKGSKPDEDWYRISQHPYASYEVVVEATAGEIATPVLERIAADGTTVTQTAVGVGGVGFTRSLRWQNGAAAVDDQYVRVRSGGCVKCKKDALYRIRAFETTYRLSRFNNSGTQVTVLVVQNPSHQAVTGDVHYWSAAGALLATDEFTLAPKAVAVIQTQIAAPGVAGSATISHDGRYGDLAGKSVALEPATGFSFDTALESRTR